MPPILHDLSDLCTIVVTQQHPRISMTKTPTELPLFQNPGTVRGKNSFRRRAIATRQAPPKSVATAPERSVRPHRAALKPEELGFLLFCSGCIGLVTGLLVFTILRDAPNLHPMPIVAPLVQD